MENQQAQIYAASQSHGVEADREHYSHHCKAGVSTGLVGEENSGVALGTQHGFLADNFHQRTTRGPTFTFRPLEAKLEKDKTTFTHLNPYCKFKLGWHRAKSAIAQVDQVEPEMKDLESSTYRWGDSIILKAKKGEEFATLTVKDNDRPVFSNRLGKAKIPLDKIMQDGRVTEWIPIEMDGKITGQVKCEFEYQPAL